MTKIVGVFTCSLRLSLLRVTVTLMPLEVFIEMCMFVQGVVTPIVRAVTSKGGHFRMRSVKAQFPLLRRQTPHVKEGLVKFVYLHGTANVLHSNAIAEGLIL